MANECIPLYDAGDEVTVTASANVTGKTFVSLTGAVNASNGTLATAGPCPAAAKAFGVANKDAASGTRLVALRGPRVVPVACAGTFAAGDEVEVGANGQAVKLASGKPVGYAMSAGSANNEAYVAIY